MRHARRHFVAAEQRDPELGGRRREDAGDDPVADRDQREHRERRGDQNGRSRRGAAERPSMASQHAGHTIAHESSAVDRVTVVSPLSRPAVEP